MKRLLILFALLGGVMACSDNDKNEVPAPAPSQGLQFVGTLEVTPEAGSRYEAFSEVEISMELQATGESLYHLLMPEIKFVPQMPWLAIEVRDLQDQDSGDGIRFDVAETIPYFMGAPYEAYTISNLRGEYDPAAQTLTVDFSCNTMQVHFEGRQ